ncbi:MFS transporter [Streptomyces sp. NPDC058385]|uniref:MFS transporter n=1 Tax=Streptomyces sp. NPDC058385 TaxID=3346473 RepID=UPI0036542C5F
MSAPSAPPISPPVASSPSSAGLRRPGNGTPVGRRRRPVVGHGVGFWFAAAAFTVLMAFGTEPTPLWPMYQARDGFGTTTVTVAFAMMIVGATAGFLTLGHLSDRLGRRRIVVPALAVAIVAALVYLMWPELPGLLVGRFLNGVGVGLMASTATMYLHDLYQQEHPDRPGSAVPGVVAAAANLGGLALGPLTAGLIAQWAPHPLTTTQAAFALALSVSLVLVLATPETVDRTARAGAGDDRPPRFALRRGTGAAFAAASALGTFAFALLGVISALGAIVIRTKLGIDSHIVGGLAPTLMFAASALGQLALGALPSRRLAATGAVVFPLGLGLVALSLHFPTLPLFLVAVSVAGAGAGLLFKSGIGWAGALAVPASRAGVLAVFFTIAYLGMGLPAILLSVIIRHTSVEATMTGFAVAVSVGAVAAVRVAMRLTEHGLGAARQG